MEFNYYEILGLNRNASEEEIKIAFKTLAKKYHPDKNAGNPVYEEHFKKINLAYQTLSNIQKRQRYDLKLFSSVQKTSERNQRTARTQNAYRPMNKKGNPPIDKKQTYLYTTLTVAALLVFITGAVFFYHYMNSITARDHYEEGLKMEALNKDFFAMEHFSAAIGYDETLVDAYIHRGNLRLKMTKDYEGALKDYSKAIQQKEDDQLYFNRAKCFLKLKRYEEVMYDLNKAIDLNPSYDSLFYYRGEVNNYILKKYKEAIQDYDKAIALNKKFKDAILGKALSRQSLKDYEASIHDFSTLIAMKPDDGSYFYYRGYSKMSLNDSTGACTDWFQAERLFFQEARNMINRYCN